MPEPSRSPRAEKTAAEAAQSARKHVFAVNGAAEFLDVVRLLLEEELYNVTTTNFVPKTFDQLLALEPDLVVIDLAVQVQSGWDLLERLHADATTHGIPVLVVSTNQQILEEVQQSPDRYGGQRFLAKPFDIDELLTMVRDLIGAA